MDRQIEQQLWNAGRESEPYPKTTWHAIIDTLLDEFRQAIDCDFERDLDINLDISKANSPSFGQWIWSRDTGKPVSVVWLAVIGGDMVGSLADNDIFEVSLTLFMFEAFSKKRIHLVSGESLIEFLYRKGSDGTGYWHYIGWCKDEWEEWKDVEYK